MPHIAYSRITIRGPRLATIQKVNKIVKDYREQGYNLTLRQVYYQFVSRGWIENKQSEYKRLGDIINDGRMAGLIDWDAIEDRTREMGGNTHWQDPADIIGAVARSYKIDKWDGQRYRPEVWVEKDALEGVVGTICKRLDIPFFSCRGYTSQTAMWDNARRLMGLAKGGWIPVVLHLGDHDPSGLDMSRDIKERLRLFMENWGTQLKFERLALNMDQVEEYNPPPNPAKATDSRFADYQNKFGDESWELDALEPSVITELIQTAVDKLRDDDMFQEMQDREDEERKLLTTNSEKWDKVAKFLEKFRKD